MNLYRHYKNKAYRILKEVKHSETLEDMVLYESLYDNPLGSLWVRPKTMFYENIEYNGQTRARFAKVECTIETHSSFSGSNRQWIESIAKSSYDDWNAHLFDERAQNFKVFHIGFAFIDKKPVAFKIGYAQTPNDFYSWLGAVLPDFRRSGIGSALMEAQHAWCLSQDYRKIRTKCLNFNRAMLGLNLNHGFLVYDTETTKQGLKLILEKNLVDP